MKISPTATGKRDSQTQASMKVLLALGRNVHAPVLPKLIYPPATPCIVTTCRRAPAGGTDQAYGPRGLAPLHDWQH